MHGRKKVASTPWEHHYQDLFEAQCHEAVPQRASGRGYLQHHPVASISLAYNSKWRKGVRPSFLTLEVTDRNQKK